MISRAIRFAGTQAAGFLVLLSAVFSTAAVASPIENYRLTEAVLGKYERATEAMYQYAVEHPEVMAAMEEDESDSEDMANVEQMTRAFDKKAPGLRKEMEKSGLSLEEYFTFSVALAANAFGAAMMDQFGGGNEAELTAIQRDNIAFARKHMKRFEEFGKRMQEKYGPLMEGSDDSYEEEAYEEEELGDDNYHWQE